MKQYKYQITNTKTEQKYSVYATAKSPQIARNQIARKYTGFTVSEESVAEYAPHYVYGEIDCSMCDENDVPVAA